MRFDLNPENGSKLAILQEARQLDDAVHLALLAGYAGENQPPAPDKSAFKPFMVRELLRMAERKHYRTAACV